MRYGPILSTLLAHLLLIFSCSAWSWQPPAPQASWAGPAPSIEHLIQVCDLSGTAEIAHPFIRLQRNNDQYTEADVWGHSALRASPSFPLAAARLEPCAESELEPTARSLDTSLLHHPLRFLTGGRTRQPALHRIDDVARHQIPSTTADPAQTAGPRPPPVRHHHV
ncbi:MAG: hypothetical protein KGO50_12955 [Myxococcales bacterium]|nr:hypothetical protein [Myxococcales bacterium]